MKTFRQCCRVLPSAEDEEKLAFHGCRVRGETCFQGRWILVKGVCKYLLVHAIGMALGWLLDERGVAVIEFQDSGGAGICAALAEAFDIPWHLAADGDKHRSSVRQEVLRRGFNDDDLTDHLTTASAFVVLASISAFREGHLAC